MKRKNTFKPSDFKYEPVDQKKKPFYMMGMEKHVVNLRAFEYLALGVIVLIIFFLSIILGT